MDWIDICILLIPSIIIFMVFRYMTKIEFSEYCSPERDTKINFVLYCSYKAGLYVAATYCAYLIFDETKGTMIYESYTNMRNATLYSVLVLTAIMIAGKYIVSKRLGAPFGMGLLIADVLPAIIILFLIHYNFELKSNCCNTMGWGVGPT